MIIVRGRYIAFYCKRRVAANISEVPVCETYMRACCQGGKEAPQCGKINFPFYGLLPGFINLQESNHSYMFSLSGFFNSIILLGTLQGFIVYCLLFYSKKSKLPDRLLAKLIFLMSLASLNLYLNEIGITNLNGLTSTLSALIPMVIVMPMGPLVYFYIRSSLDPEFKMTKKCRRHFLPIIIDLVPSLTVIIFFAGCMQV